MVVVTVATMCVMVQGAWEAWAKNANHQIDFERVSKYEHSILEIIDEETFLVYLITSQDQDGHGTFTEETIRLIGVDLPEYGERTGHTHAERCGQEAYYTLNRLIEDRIYKEVFLEFDVQKRNTNGQLLVYVFVEKKDDDGKTKRIFVNAELVRKGLAIVKVHKYNTKYSELFLKLEKQAKEKKLGLWGEDTCVETFEEKQKEQMEELVGKTTSTILFHILGFCGYIVAGLFLILLWKKKPSYKLFLIILTIFFVCLLPVYIFCYFTGFHQMFLKDRANRVWFEIDVDEYAGIYCVYGTKKPKKPNVTLYLPFFTYKNRPVNGIIRELKREGEWFSEGESAEVINTKYGPMLKYQRRAYCSQRELFRTDLRKAVSIKKSRMNPFFGEYSGSIGLSDNQKYVRTLVYADFPTETLHLRYSIALYREVTSPLLWMMGYAGQASVWQTINEKYFGTPSFRAEDTIEISKKGWQEVVFVVDEKSVAEKRKTKGAEAEFPKEVNSRVKIDCYDDHIYWFNSIGVPEEIHTKCGQHSECDFKTKSCECTWNAFYDEASSKCYRKEERRVCVGSDVYWENGLGHITELIHRCGPHATCKDGKCAGCEDGYIMKVGKCRSVSGKDETGFCPDGFAYIKPGEFWMGSPITEKYRSKDETRHHVVISNGFCMGKYEVTQYEWIETMLSTPFTFKNKAGNGKERFYPMCPAESISWNDTQEFIKKYNAKHGGGYRLPTEAEWEYAIRAGSNSSYYFGEQQSLLDNAGWYLDNSDRFYRSDPPLPKSVRATGEKEENPWGLYDMIGNVSEWTQDWYGEYSTSNTIDPKGPQSGQYRVIRGCSFLGGAGACRSAMRSYSPPDRKSPGIGFRLVRDISQDAEQ